MMNNTTPEDMDKPEEDEEGNDDEDKGEEEMPSTEMDTTGSSGRKLLCGMYAL